MAVRVVALAAAVVIAAAPTVVVGGDDSAGAGAAPATDAAAGPAEDDRSAPGSAGTGDVSPADIPPFTEAPDGGELRVVESGVSVFTDPSDGDRQLTWGVVLENTSDHVAVSTDVRAHAVDDAGERVATGWGWRRVLGPETVVQVAPGARFSLGHTAELTGGEPADLEVEVSGSQWVPADAVGIVFPTLEATAVAVPGGADSTRLDLDVSSSLDEELEARVSAVMRDQSGEVIGGFSRQNSVHGDSQGLMNLDAGTSSRKVLYPFVLPADATFDVSLDPTTIVEDDQ